MSDKPTQFVTHTQLADALRTFARESASAIRSFVGGQGSRVVVHAGQATKRVVQNARRDATTGEWSAQIVDTPIDDDSPRIADGSTDAFAKLAQRVAALEDALGGDPGKFKGSYQGQGRQLSRHAEHLGGLETRLKRLERP